MIRLGLVGLGRWGKNFYKTIDKNPNCSLSAVCGRSSQLDILDHYAGFKTEDWKRIFRICCVDGVIIATPPSSHEAIARCAFHHRVPVLIEKPLTLCLDSTIRTSETSKSLGVSCLVDLTHIFSEAYTWMKKELLESQDWLQITRISCSLKSFGPFRADVPMSWDWYYHPLSFAIDLLDLGVEDIEVITVDHDIENNSGTLFIRTRLMGRILMDCAISNVSTQKKIDFSITTNRKTYWYDGVLNQATITTDNSVVYKSFRACKMPLDSVVEEFLNVIKNDVPHYDTLRISSIAAEVIECIDKKLVHTGGRNG